MIWIQTIQRYGKTYKIVLPREFVALNDLKNERYVVISVNEDGSAVMEKINMKRKGANEKRSD